MSTPPKKPRLKLVHSGPLAAGRLALFPAADAPPERADAAANRTKILDAARGLLAHAPMGHIGMDEVAQAAGVGKGTLYRRFQDRAALCRALLDDHERKLQAQVMARWGLHKNAPAALQLKTLLMGLMDFALENAALLAEAVASHRAPCSKFDNPPAQWRAHEVTRWLRALEVASPHVMARLILAALDPELILLHRAAGISDAAQRRAFHQLWQHGIHAQLPE